MIRTLLIALAAAAAAWPGAALAQYDVPPRTPPLICRDNVFVDIVGTSAADTLRAYNRATRVWGERGDDVLRGSSNRASCLLGGPGDDVLGLEGGGGIAMGGPGRDVLFGSSRGDVIDGGGQVDAVFGGAGDDKIDTRDGHPEVVDCGAGADIARADRVDILIGCELANLAGRRATRLVPVPAQTSITGTVRVRMTVPQAAGPGAYRVLYLTDAAGRLCTGGPVEITRFPAPGARVRKGQHVRIGLRRPAGGWCPGNASVAVVRSPGQSLPLVGVARFAFTAR